MTTLDQAPDESWVRDESGAAHGKTDLGALLNPLEFKNVSDVMREISDAPPVGYLAKKAIPADAYGVLAAMFKAGKTWLVADLAIAVAANLAWLGHFEIERSGAVLLFLGEGGPRKMIRRLKAVADHYDVSLEDLPIRLCFRAPHLASHEHLEQVEREIAATKPVLVILDPLYLSAHGASGSQLYEMGALLESIQAICQRHAAALLISHHFNRGEGKGAARMSGAGPAEWGRFLVTASVVSSRTDPMTQESDVVLAVDIIGDEVADTSLRVRRKVAALDPDDLSSALLYSVEVLADVPDEIGDQRLVGLRPATRRVLSVLEHHGDSMTSRDIGDAVADEGYPLKNRTILAACKELHDAELVSESPILGSNAKTWRAEHRAEHLDVRNIGELEAESVL